MKQNGQTTLKDLVQDPKNARKHNPRNIGMIEQSIRQIGAARSGVIDENGVILAGNGTYEALAAAGIEKIKVVECDGNEWVVVKRTGLTEEQKRALAIADNRTAELATWDAPTLEAQGIDLAPWFSEAEQLGMKSPSVEETQIDTESTTDDALVKLVLQAHASKITSNFLDGLHKFCGKHGVKVLDDDPSRPNRRYWGSWKKGIVEKPA